MSANVTEMKFLQVAPQTLLVDGGTDGKVAILGACSFFKVGQKIYLKSSSQSPKPVKICRFESDTEFIVGPFDKPVSKGLGARLDISAYTTADTATVSSLEQPRPSFGADHILRYAYAEEPAMALRNHLVDECGNALGSNADNPLHTKLSDGSISIGTVNAELEVQLSHQDNVPDAGDVADSVQIGDGVDILAINSDGSINPTEWLIQIQRGLVPGASAINKFGENESIPVNGEDVWNNPDNLASYPFPINAITVDLFSDNATDTLAGTGARTLEIFGLDANFDEQSEIINLNGLTAVSTVNTYIRVFRVIVRTAGTGGENAGDIRAENQSTTEIIAAIKPGDNQTKMAIYTVPNNKTGYLLQLWYSAEANKAPQVTLRVRPEGEVFQIRHHVNGALGFNDISFPAPIKIDAKSDIKIIAVSSSGTIHLSAGFLIVLLDN